MTLEQRIQWVALPDGPGPDGPEGPTWRLSAFIAPRLRSDEGATLAAFPDLAAWPERVAGATFTVELADGTAVPATVASAPPDPALWAAMFGPATLVEPFALDDVADRPLVSYSVREVVGTLRGIYARTAAASPDELPRLVPDPAVETREPALSELFAEVVDAVVRGPLGEGIRDDVGLDRRVEAHLAEARAESARRRAAVGPRSAVANEPLPADGTAATHLQRALLFHRRPGPPVPLPGSDGDGTTAGDALDLHEQLSALGDHPALLRRLGLVVDLTIPAVLAPADDLDPLLLRVRPTWTPLLDGGRSVDVVPWTACAVHERDGVRLFGPASADPGPDGPLPPTGLLPLPSSAIEVSQLDVDGAALKALVLAATLARAAGRAPGATPLGSPERTGAPALRTSGLAVVQVDRAGVLQRRFARTAALHAGVEAGAPLTLHAGDVTRAHRLDVWDSSAGAWRSLHERVVTYHVTGQAEPLPPVEEEGSVELSLVGRAVAPGERPDPDGELYVHEDLVTWDGWSLSAPRPGKALSRDARAPVDGDEATQPRQVANDARTSSGLSIEAAVRPGTLPALRFGRDYRFRIRVVDLAGNGPTLGEADERSHLGGGALVAPGTGGVRYRRFEPVPPPTLVPRARPAEGGSLRRLVIRSDGRGAEGWATEVNASELVTGGGHEPYLASDDRHVVPPKTSLDLVERHGLLDAAIGTDGSDPDQARRATMAAVYELARREKGTLADVATGPATPEGDVVCAQAQLDLPYLPDPWSAGAVLRGLPGQPADVPVVLPFEGPAWHRASPFRLVLVEGAATPVWDGAARTLTVALPPAATASVRIGSQLGGDPADVGIVGWCEEELDGDELDGVLRAVAEDRCWLVTPWHDVELVHAVQRPLDAPVLVELEVTRTHGATDADLFGIVALHPPSTERIDLVGRWTEAVDDLALPGPEARTAEAVVLSLPLAVAAEHGDEVEDVRSVPYSVREEHLASFATLVREHRPGPPVAPQVFGDTRHRRVAYRVVAATPFREHFPAAWADDPALLTRTSEAVEVDVPASAPPPPPRVLHVVPTMGWESDTDGGTHVRRRRGGGLRVHLDRPWLASGDGELLGVVVGTSIPSPASTDHHLITLLGQDPVRAGGPLAAASAATFRTATAIAEGVHLREDREPGRRHTVVCHPVAYDGRAGRWWCDLELDTELATMPFVRLALVRYQPSALAGCHVSEVVRCDITQPLPDRTLTVARDPAEPAEPATVTVTLAGPASGAHRGATGGPVEGLSRVVVCIEERGPDEVDDLVAWTPVEGSAVTLTGALDADGATATWSGRVAVGGDATRPRRVAVVEEDHLAGLSGDGDADGVVHRVVYADAVALEPG